MTNINKHPWMVHVAVNGEVCHVTIQEKELLNSTTLAEHLYIMYIIITFRVKIEIIWRVFNKNSHYSIVGTSEHLRACYIYEQCY